jgi:hypothetical protein
VVLEGLRVANENNWFPTMTLMVGNPGETDEDSRATLDLLYEIERRGLFAVLIPSIFTPLHDTRMEKQKGVSETRNLTPLQWQVIMKCWKMDLGPSSHTWWAPLIWKVGSMVTWLLKLRRTNGPHFTWPLIMFSGVIPEKVLGKMGKIYVGQPLKTKNRKELLATLKEHYRQFLRADNGDMPGDATPAMNIPKGAAEEGLEVLA